MPATRPTQVKCPFCSTIELDFNLGINNCPHCAGQYEVDAETFEIVGLHSPEERADHADSINQSRATMAAVHTFIHNQLNGGAIKRLLLVIVLLVLALREKSAPAIKAVFEIFAGAYGKAETLAVKAFEGTSNVITAVIIRIIAAVLGICLYLGGGALANYVLTLGGAEIGTTAALWVIFNGAIFLCLVMALSVARRHVKWWLAAAAGLVVVKTFVFFTLAPMWAWFGLAIAVMTAAFLYPAPPLKKILGVVGGNLVGALALGFIALQLLPVGAERLANGTSPMITAVKNTSWGQEWQASYYHGAANAEVRAADDMAEKKLAEVEKQHREVWQEAETKVTAWVFSDPATKSDITLPKGKLLMVDLTNTNEKYQGRTVVKYMAKEAGTVNPEQGWVYLDQLQTVSTDEVAPVIKIGHDTTTSPTTTTSNVVASYTPPPAPPRIKQESHVLQPGEEKTFALKVEAGDTAVITAVEPDTDWDAEGAQIWGGKSHVTPWDAVPLGGLSYSFDTGPHPVVANTAKKAIKVSITLD